MTFICTFFFNFYTGNNIQRTSFSYINVRFFFFLVRDEIFHNSLTHCSILNSKHCSKCENKLRFAYESPEQREELSICGRAKKIFCYIPLNKLRLDFALLLYFLFIIIVVVVVLRLLPLLYFIRLCAYVYLSECVCVCGEVRVNAYRIIYSSK